MKALFHHLLNQNNGVYRLLAVSTFVAMYLLYDLSGYPGSSYNVPRKHSVDTSCHYAEHDDALEAADGNYSLPLRSIFFIETSCRGGLNSRQACSVESAARAHPQWQITVFFLAPVCEDNLNHTCLRTLGQLGNVKFVRIKIKEFTQNTLLEPLIHENHLQNTSYPIENFSNALRYLILYKWGGIYLDTDMIVVKDLSALGANWVGKEDPGSLNSAAMRISSDVIGRRFATGLLDEFKYEYSVRMRGMNGPQVITRVLEEYWCHLYKPQHWNPRTCKGIRVYKPRILYPIHYKRAKVLFENSNLDVVNNFSHAIHTWNRLTKNRTISNNSPYARLAKQYCPSIYNLFGNKFGE